MWPTPERRRVVDPFSCQQIDLAKPTPVDPPRCLITTISHVVSVYFSTLDIRFRVRTFGGMYNIADSVPARDRRLALILLGRLGDVRNRDGWTHPLLVQKAVIDSLRSEVGVSVKEDT